MKDPYQSDEFVVSNQKATEILASQGITVFPNEHTDAIQKGLDLGILALAEVCRANDYVHGPFETYMLAYNGIIVVQPNPLEEYTVYHVVEREVYLKAHPEQQ